MLKIKYFLLFLYLLVKAESVLKKHPIIVSFTTINSRIPYIEPMINSLLKQTLRPDKINLYISDEKGILNNGIKKNKIPVFINELVNKKLINLIYTKDIGPHTKLIPCLSEYWNKDCVIITVDDDRIYPNNLIKILYKNYLAKNCIISCTATKMVFNNNNLLSIEKYINWPKAVGKDLLNFAKGFDGVLYKPEFFTKVIFDINGIKTCCDRQDDVWFNLMRLIKKIPVFAIKEKMEISSLIIPKKTELWTTNRLNNDLYIKKTFEYMLDKKLL
jgi:hypothetical protein